MYSVRHVLLILPMHSSLSDYVRVHGYKYYVADVFFAARSRTSVKFVLAVDPLRAPQRIRIRREKKKKRRENL